MLVQSGDADVHGSTTNCLNPDQVDTLNAYFNAARDPLGLVAYEGYPVSDLYDNTPTGLNMFLWVEIAGPAASTMPRNHGATRRRPPGSSPTTCYAS